MNNKLQERQKVLVLVAGKRIEGMFQVKRVCDVFEKKVRKITVIVMFLGKK